MTVPEQSARTVLVVDPCLDTQALILEAARSKGLSVITATDPQMARMSWADTMPEILMTDLFSGRAGIELIRHIRREHAYCSAIVLAGEAPPDMVVDAFRAGAVDYLRKPFLRNELSDSLDRALQAIPITMRNVPGVEHVDYRLAVGNDLAGVESSASWLVQGTAGFLPETQRLHLRATLIELMVNAIEHGSLEISYQEKRDALAENRYEALVAARSQDPCLSRRRVMVRALYDPRARLLRYTVSDEGKGFEWKALLEATSGAAVSGDPNGRGLYLAHAFFPQVSYNESGNEVTFTIPLP